MATVLQRFEYQVPAGVSSVSGTATVTGYPAWYIFMNSATGSTVTDPTITVSSGLDPSLFPNLPTPTFPTSCGLASLTDGQGMSMPELDATALPISFSLGYDSSWSVSPAQVPAGGGDVTVSVSLTIRGARTDAFIFLGDVFLNSKTPDDTVVSMANPTNLDQGETASVDLGNGVWTLSNPQLNKTYVFTALVHIANPTAASIAYVPGGQIYLGTPPTGSPFTVGPTDMVTVPVPSLDGSQPGSGAVTFSIDQAATWAPSGPSTSSDGQYVALYQTGLFPTTRAQCQNGGWQEFPFKNQGACIQYVNTGK